MTYWNNFRETVIRRIPPAWSEESIGNWLDRFDTGTPPVVRELLHLPPPGDEAAVAALVNDGHLMPWLPHLERFTAALSDALAPRGNAEDADAIPLFDAGQVRRVRNLLTHLVPLLSVGESWLHESPAEAGWRTRFNRMGQVCRATGLRMLLRQLCERATVTDDGTLLRGAALRDLLAQLLEKEEESSFGPLIRRIPTLPRDQEVDLLVQLFQFVTDVQIGQSRVLFPVYTKSSADPGARNSTEDGKPAAGEHPDWWPDLDETEYGALIEVTFTSVRRADLADWPALKRAFDYDLLQLDDAHLFVAPWSRYLPVDEQTDRGWGFQELRASLIPLLRDLLGAGSSGRGNIGDLAEDLVVLAEFEPVSLDLPEAQPGHDISSLLSPRTVPHFSGPSLGLAFALAGWAAAKQLSIPVCIATGEIGAQKSGDRYIDSTIYKVGGIRQKATTIADYLSAVIEAGHQPPPTFMHADNKAELQNPDLPPADLRNVYQRVSEFIESDRELGKFFDTHQNRLTDGMDALRNRLRNQQSSHTGCFQHKELFDKAKGVLDATLPFEDPQGFNRTDWDATNTILEHILPGLTAASSSTDTREVNGSQAGDVGSGATGSGLHVVPVPFGEDPSIAAAWFVAELTAVLWPEELESWLWQVRPVVLPVSLKTLASSLPISKQTAESEVPRSAIDSAHLNALQSACHIGLAAISGTDQAELTSSSGTPDELFSEAGLRIALRRPGKLIVVAFDESSRDLPFGDDSLMSRRDDALRWLCANTPPAPQHTVIVVVSDLHAQRRLEAMLPELVHVPGR